MHILSLSLALGSSLGIAGLSALRSFAADPAPKATTSAKKPAAPAPPHVQTLPVMLEADGTLRFDFSEEKVVLEGGLQPFAGKKWGVKDQRTAASDFLPLIFYQPR